MSERPKYTRSQIRALGGGALLDDSDDDASFHESDNDSANTVVRRYSTPISPRTRAVSETTILNILPDQRAAEPVPEELQYLRTSRPFPGREESYALTIPRPVGRVGYSDGIHTRGMGRMGEKPTSMSMEYYYGGPPTPVNDRPFVLYALEQITREGSRDGSETLQVRSYESTSTLPSAVYPAARLPVDKHASWPRNSAPVEERNHPTLDPNFKFNPKSSLLDCGEELYLAQDHPRVLEKNPRTPPLNFLPRTLHHWTRNLFALLVLLITIAVLFCAEYSRRHNGLWEYANPFDGRYVLSHYLFPILAAGIYLWIQGIGATLWRITPFMVLTSAYPRKRNEALFFNLYPSAMLLPRLGLFRAGQPLLAVISILAFPALFTIPLSSALFTTQLHDGVWRYTTNLPIAYLLVTCYILLLLSLFGFWVLLFRRPLGTGLKSDPRSLADIIALLSRSNCLEDYAETELMNEKQMRSLLVDRCDKIGYWRTTKFPREDFYGIAADGGPARRYSVRDGYAFPSKRRGGWDAEKGNDIDDEKFSRAYVPWYINKAAVVAWPLLFGPLYIALMVVALLPETAVGKGFSPGLNAKPDATGFSRSNFTYSFIPSLLGLALFIGMQRLYFTLCRLYPWSELSKDGGSTAAHSLLLDYAASATTPFGPLPMAISNGHWLITALSIMTPLSILFPILGGGCFTTYTAQPSGTLLIFPHKTAFYTLLAILGLYFLTLVVVAVSVLEMGKRLKMPKNVRSLADLTSLLYASGVLGDAAFVGVKGGVDLRTRLLMGRERGGREVRYFFGSFVGRDGERHLGIERVGRWMGGARVNVRREMSSRRRGRGRWLVGG